MRIAYLADPNSVHTRRWLGFFVERGHAIQLLIGTDDQVRDGLDPRVEVHRYRRFGRRRLPFLSSLQGRRALRALLAELQPDLLHAHYLSRYGWQARLSGFHPLVVTPWGSDLLVTMPRSWRARLWGRATLRAADLVTVVSTQIRDMVLAAGAHPERVQEVQFGVDTTHFSPGGGAARMEERYIFSPRTLRPLYRHEVAIAALAGLPPDVTLVMSGRGADPAYRQQLVEQARIAGVEARIRIEADIDDERMLALYRGAAAVISVPQSDGLPVTLLEAMACGTPVVASDLPPVREVLEPLAPQLLVPVGDADATAEALRGVLDLPAAERAHLAAALRARAVERYDRTANMLHMETLYRRLVDR